MKAVPLKRPLGARKRALMVKQEYASWDAPPFPPAKKTEGMEVWTVPRPDGASEVSAQPFTATRALPHPVIPKEPRPLQPRLKGTQAITRKSQGTRRRRGNIFCDTVRLNSGGFNTAWSLFPRI